MINSTELYRLLENVARKPVNLAMVPSHFNAIIKLQNAIDDPNGSHRKLAKILLSEPLISARLVQLANAAKYYDYQPVKDVEAAVFRLGLPTVRQIALGAILTQLTQSKTVLVFSSVSRQVWIHSLYTASAAYVLAAHHHSVRPDEALFSGLVLNLGAFYLLYRASMDRETHRYPEEVQSWLGRHLFTSTTQLMKVMKMPSALIQTTDLARYEGSVVETEPKTLQDLLYAAHLMANERYPWEPEESHLDLLTASQIELFQEVDRQYESLQASFQ